MSSYKAAVTFLFASLFMASGALAQGKVDSKLMEVRNRIEAEVNRNITQLMLTRLDPKAFNVASRVKVIETPEEPPKPQPPQKEPEGLPAGMDLGPIDVRELIDSYKRQIQELKLQKEHVVEKPEQKFTVTKIEVIVGLDESFDDQYVHEFNQWLVKRVKSDYGASASATTNKIKLLAEKPVPDTHSWRDFLPLLAYVALGLCVLLAAYFIGRGLRRLGEGSKNIIIEHKTPLLTENSNHQEGEEPKEADDDAFEPLPVRAEREISYEQLVGKIALLCVELGANLDEMVRVWLEAGNEGFKKTAILIDTIVSIREKFLEHREAVIQIPIPLDKSLASSHQENLSEAYRLTSSLSDSDRLRYLDEIYWDLISLRTLGVQSLRRPFDYLQSINDFAFVEALKHQAKDSRALALIYSDPERVITFLSHVEEEQKEKILVDMCNLSNVSNSQIWDLDSAMKLNMLNQSASPDANLVDLFPRTVEVLQSLGILEEINLLRRVVVGLRDQGLSLKQQFTSLAFIDEWKADYVNKLVGIASTSELVHLCQILPEAQDVVLSSVPEKTKMIIEDDLNMNRPEEAVIAKSLKSLKQKWINLCLSESITMSKVISYRNKEADLHVVA